MLQYTFDWSSVNGVSWRICYGFIIKMDTEDLSLDLWIGTIYNEYASHIWDYTGRYTCMKQVTNYLK